MVLYMEVSFLTWNIWYEENIENIAAFLNEHPADIVCLQELTNGYAKTHSDTGGYIAEQLGYNHFVKTIPLDNADWEIANGIFTRFPIKNQKSVWINEPGGTGDYDDQYRAYVETSLDIEGKELTVATAHMSYTDAFKVTGRKLAETAQLVEEIKAKDHRFIVAGDFNAEPGSEVINQISKYLKHAGPDYAEKTWTTKPFSYNGFEANTLDWRLDYIFATPDVNVISAQILQTDFSDHLPVLARIKL